MIANELEQKSYEIIVVDDNSPDGTSELVTKLKSSYPNLELLSRKKKTARKLAVFTQDLFDQ